MQTQTCTSFLVSFTWMHFFPASFLLLYKNVFWVIPFNCLWSVCTKEIFIINKYTQLIKILFLRLLSLYLEKPYNIYSPFMQINLEEENYGNVKNGHMQATILNKHFNVDLIIIFSLCLRLCRVRWQTSSSHNTVITSTTISLMSSKRRPNPIKAYITANQLEMYWNYWNCW